MYIRTKTRTNKSGKSYTYAYIAEIRQRKRSHPKQKILKYLGKVYKVKRTANKTLKPKPTSSKERIKELLISELKNHGFNLISQEILENESIEVNLNEITVKEKNTDKNICVQLNQGLLCTETLQKIINYEPPKEDMKRISKHFAKIVIEAGIKPSEPEIIEIFKQIQTNPNNDQQ